MADDAHICAALLLYRLDPNEFQFPHTSTRTMRQVFLSHSKEDHRVAAPYLIALTEMGFDIRCTTWGGADTYMG